jgi:hypothetical protein
MRSLLNKRLLKIKLLRNQIAHHERISKRDLETDYQEVLETIKWLCPITSQWVKDTSRFDNIPRMQVSITPPASLKRAAAC